MSAAPVVIAGARTGDPQPQPPQPPRKRSGRPKGPPKPPPVPAEVAASPQARRTAAVLLEVLAGLRGTADAARELTVTPMRYYHLEARAIGGLIAACEPRLCGVQPAAREAQELARLREQARRQGQELNQVRSVLRTTQRQLGVAHVASPTLKPCKPGKDGKPTRHKVRRPTVRALTMVRRLMQAEATAAAASTAPTPVATSPGEPGGG
jgi:hypothetical protein